MKALYRIYAKKEAYISVVASEYFIQYESWGLTFEQIKAPIKYIVESLDYEINQCKSENQFDICVYKKCGLIFDNASCIDEEGFSQNFIAILYYFRGKEPAIKYTISDRCKVSFPEENKEKYLAFISTMTRTVVTEILESTLAHLLNTKKSGRDESPLQRATVFRSINNADASTSNLQLGAHYGVDSTSIL